MKILILSDLWVPFPGGAERFMQNTAWALKQRGADVQVLTLYCKLAREEQGVLVDRLFVPVGISQEDFWAALRAKIEAYAPDAILTHQWFPDKFRAELPTLGIPIVQVVHAAPVWPYVDFVVYNSEHTRKRNDPAYACHSAHAPGEHLANCNVIDGMVIIPPAFEDCVAPYHGRAIGFIKPVEHKGVDLVYQLAQALPHRHFVILRGEWWHFDKLVDLSNVEYIAPVEHMRDFYRRCCMVLVPSLYEDAGTVPQEATLNGLPCISSNIGGLPETNGGIVKGLVLGGDVSMSEWRTVIEQLFDEPAFYRATVAQQQERLNTFGWDDKFDRLFEKMIRLTE